MQTANISKKLTLIAVVGLLASCGAEQDDSDSSMLDGPQAEGKADYGKGTPDDMLRGLAEGAEFAPLDTSNVLPMSDPLVVLGQSLFFDKALSGNSDIACATCHHPAFGTSDNLSLPVGVGGSGLGAERQLGEDIEFIPRNSPEIFNRGAAEWNTMFWDARVSAAEQYFASPAGSDLPKGLDSVLAVQAMFPPTSDGEMRGFPGENNVADLEELPEIWAALTGRIMSYEGYESMFAEAFPEVASEDVGFEHIANALAAYEVAAFTRADTPFDRFVAGDDEAMTPQEKRGAELFFGDANCASCHNGPLLTDQKSYVVAVPQFGPGKGDAAPFDEGRFLETGDDADRFAFRTPPLRNVELTGPYFHSGAYTNLFDVVLHHLDPAAAVMEYDAEAIVRGDVAATMVTDPEFVEDCVERIAPELKPKREMTTDDVADLVAFLEALTDPSARDMTDVIPGQVPSGLPVDGVPAPSFR